MDAFAVGTGKDDINGIPVDGMLLTMLTPTREHLWTFAMGTSTIGASANNCPCNTLGGTTPGTFVGSNYFCESGNDGVGMDSNKYHRHKPLWDGQGAVWIAWPVWFRLGQAMRILNLAVIGARPPPHLFF
jgi:hypothetical protein